jgi:MFS family permease
MVLIDGTVVNLALPALQANLNATAVDVQWVIESYALFLAALLLAGGSLGDHFGRRLILGVGVALFTLASLWCGLAPSIVQLIAARSLQGLDRNQIKAVNRICCPQSWRDSFVCS